MMRKLLAIGILAVSLISCNSAKKDEPKKDGNEVAALERRLNEYLELNQQMNFDGLIEYIHPRLFEMAPKSQMLEAMKGFFNSEEIKVKLDSLRVDSIYPIFELEKAKYAKVDYSMVMYMDFSPTDSLITETDKEQNQLIRASMAEQYGEENITVDETTGVVRVRTTSPMVAIKDDKVKDWSFIGLREGDPMGEKIFSKELRDKLDTYKK